MKYLQSVGARSPRRLVRRAQELREERALALPWAFWNLKKILPKRFRLSGRVGQTSLSSCACYLSCFLRNNIQMQLFMWNLHVGLL